MILLSELSRRRIRSIQKLIRVGRDEVVVVLRVDKEKGYIDLSKRRVSGMRAHMHRRAWERVSNGRCSGRHRSVRGALQQGEDGGVDLQARGREDEHADGDSLHAYRLAAEQEIHARARCV